MRLQRASSPSWWSNFLLDTFGAWNAGMSGALLTARVTNLVKEA